MTTTYDRHGHLMPGNEADAVSLVDDYLERAAVRDNCATVDTPSGFPAVSGV